MHLLHVFMGLCEVSLWGCSLTRSTRPAVKTLKSGGPRSRELKTRYSKHGPWMAMVQYTSGLQFSTSLPHVGVFLRYGKLTWQPAHGLGGDGVRCP